MTPKLLIACAFCFYADAINCQVLAPAEIADKSASALQQKYFADLKAVANDVKSHTFPYHFYFSRTLDLSERQQQSSDQRALQFGRFQGALVLKITGNYFAAYSAQAMNREQRARQTFNDVMMPIVRAAATQFKESDVPESYALEISHHVREKMLGIDTEAVENVVLVLPKAAADDLAASADLAHQNAALLKAAAYVDGKPLAFWPVPPDARAAEQESLAATTYQPPAERRIPMPESIPTAPNRAPGGSIGIDTLQEQYRADIDRMVRELDNQAHFVSYAHPVFINFHNGRYLQLSVVTTLSEGLKGSQYQLAALTFDEHVAQLIRPIMSYFKDVHNFDGIEVATTVRTGPGPGAESTLAVEYVFPLKDLRNYESYDCTGQQLLDAGFVLINGERVSLNLQAAENR